MRRMARWLAPIGLLCLVWVGSFGVVGTPTAAQPSTRQCSDSVVSFRLAQQPPFNSGEAAVYVRISAKTGVVCTVDGYPTVDVVAEGGRPVRVFTGGAPAMHSPQPIREVVRAKQPVYFGVGWYTRTPGARRSFCIGPSSVRVSLGHGTGVVLPTRPTTICALKAKPAMPGVFVSSMLHGGQFPGAAFGS